MHNCISFIPDSFWKQTHLVYIKPCIYLKAIMMDDIHKLKIFIWSIIYFQNFYFRQIKMSPDFMYLHEITYWKKLKKSCSWTQTAETNELLILFFKLCCNERYQLVSCILQLGRKPFHFSFFSILLSHIYIAICMWNFIFI